jgi:hypothetical protein
LTYFVLDITSSEKRPSAYAMLDSLGHLEEFGNRVSNQDVLGRVLKSGPAHVAIDCQLGFTLGLCCLEEDCSCTPQATLKGGECERELARRRVPCYFTTKGSIIRTIVYRGIG